MVFGGDASCLGGDSGPHGRRVGRRGVASAFASRLVRRSRTGVDVGDAAPVVVS